MTVIAIVLLIFTGLALLFLEFFVIPGVSIAGIGGLIFIAAGVVMSFTTYGATVGFLTILVTIVLAITLIVLAFKKQTWKRISLQKTSDGIVDPLKDTGIQPGDEGVTMSRLAPMGKVLIKGKTLEAKTTGRFIDQKKPVIVIKVLQTNIIVKLKN